MLIADNDGSDKEKKVKFLLLSVILSVFIGLFGLLYKKEEFEKLASFLPVGVSLSFLFIMTSKVFNDGATSWITHGLMIAWIFQFIWMICFSFKRLEARNE